MRARSNFRLTVLIICLSGTLFSAFFILKSSGRKESGPNIIIIMGDSLRADHLGCYGYDRNTSPNIDKFSENATLYENCFAPSSWTIPSNYSLLTSLYPAQHKVNNWGLKLAPNTPNLISLLSDKGYSIGLFGSNTLFLQAIKNNFIGYLDGYGEADDASSTTALAVKWMNGRKGEKIFTWIYYLEPHRPYSPPPPHDTMFLTRSARKLPIGKAEREPLGGWGSIPSLIVKDGIDNPDYYKSQYDGEIHYLDEEVGKLIDGLIKEGLFRDSLIIFASDHGESLGEHKLYFNHTFTLFDEIIKVPLLIKYPFQEKGKIIRENTSLVDIFPTVSHQLGRGIERQCEGVALNRRVNASRVLFSSNELRNISAVICGRYKLLRYPSEVGPENDYVKLFFADYPASRVQLYDIYNDPDELNDLKYAEPNICSDMLTKLSDFEVRSSDAYNDPDKFELSHETMEKLKSLGYIQ